MGNKTRKRRHHRERTAPMPPPPLPERSASCRARSAASASRRALLASLDDLSAMSPPPRATSPKSGAGRVGEGGGSRLRDSSRAAFSEARAASCLSVLAMERTSSVRVAAGAGGAAEAALGGACGWGSSASKARSRAVGRRAERATRGAGTTNAVVVAAMARASSRWRAMALERSMGRFGTGVAREVDGPLRDWGCCQ